MTRLSGTRVAGNLRATVQSNMATDVKFQAISDGEEQESPLMSVNSSAEIDIEGDITVPGAPDSDDEQSTLDEPVSETLVQD